jgi:hypothetical protein
MILPTWNNPRSMESFCKTSSCKGGKRISYCIDFMIISSKHDCCCKYLNIKLKNMTQMKTSKSRYNVISSRSSK